MYEIAGGNRRERAVMELMSNRPRREAKAQEIKSRELDVLLRHSRVLRACT
jgi:hypothetical protein